MGTWSLFLLIGTLSLLLREKSTFLNKFEVIILKWLGYTCPLPNIIHTYWLRYTTPSPPPFIPFLSPAPVLYLVLTYIYTISWWISHKLNLKSHEWILIIFHSYLLYMCVGRSFAVYATWKIAEQTLWKNRQKFIQTILFTWKLHI